MRDYYIELRLAALLVVFLLLNIDDANAQSAIIRGEVSDAATGETLPGANVIIQGTSLGVATDVDGRYTLRGIRPGDYTLEVRYLGYATSETPVTVSPNDHLELDFVLLGDAIEGDEIYIIGYQRGQSRAFTRQRESINIRSVVSAEQLDRFADQTVSGSLSRIAGMGHGGANIRGVGADMSNVSMDGQRMGSTGTGSRSVDISTISSDMVQDLEVIKVITPDMDADALSGVININTRRPVGSERAVNVRFGNGLNPRFAAITGLSNRSSFSFGDSHRDDMSYGINLSYQRSPSATESFRTDWVMTNFGDGPIDVLSNLMSTVQINTTDRYGSALQFTFQPTDQSTYHVQGMYNYQVRNRNEFTNRFAPTVSRYVNQNQTGGPGVTDALGTIRYNARMDDYKIHQITMQAGGRHLFSNFDLEYNVGWGHGRYYQELYQLPFNTDSRYDFLVNLEDRWMPIIEIAPHSVNTLFPNARQLSLSALDNRWDIHVNNDFKARMDIEIPYSRGSVKLGVSTIMNYKTGNHERYNMTYDQPISLASLELLNKSSWNVLNRNIQTYQIPWLIDMNKAKEWYYSKYPHFDMDLEIWAASSETQNYRAHELTYGSYGMGTFEFGRFRFLGGARVELTDNRYDGRQGTIDDIGRFLGGEDVSSTNFYIYLFPNAQFIFKVGRLTNARIAYSRSIGRPSFSQLSPYMMIDHSSETLRHGNPDLEPMISDNLDFLFEHYFKNVGQFTVGLYYKSLSEFVYSYTENIGTDGFGGNESFTGWRRSSYRNGEEATVYGLEISWQQSLDFLPWHFSNLGTYANYSYSHSIADADRTESVRLQGQRPHVVNAGLDYTHGRLFAQASYHWSAPSISSYGTKQWVPAIHVDERVYFDRYSDAARELSLTIRFRVSSNFRVWADGSNLLNSRRIDYFYSRDHYPYTASLNGRSFNFGIRYSM